MSGNKKFNVLLFSLALAGCSVSPTYLDDSKLTENSAHKALNPVHFKVEEGFRTSPPECIAVMRLVNKVEKEKNTKEDKKFKLLTLSDESLKQLRWSLYSQLAPYPFKDVELAVVDKALGKIKDKTDYAQIGKALQCDALLLGEVTDYHSGFFGVYSETSIGVKMKLIRAKNGETLWQGNHIAATRAGGLPFSPLGLIEGLYQATENLDEEQLRRVEDDVFRRLLFTWNKAIPDLEQHHAETRLAAKQMHQDKAEAENTHYVIAVTNLYLRAGPGTRYKAKTVLSQKNVLKLLDDKHLPWVEVSVDDGQLGYVNKKYLKAIKKFPKDEKVSTLDN